MKILVTGGAGYIGSHTVISLIENGFKVIVVDNLHSGHLEAFSKIKNYTDKDIEIYKGDFSDVNLLKAITDKHDINGVIHFAAFSLVGESVSNPIKYYKENVAKTILFLEFLNNSGINNFVLSSSAAVYGKPDKIPIKESAALAPINPYGNSKLAIENLLNYMCKANKFSYISLRYFNAAGAHPSGMIGEDHNPETHLIPNVLKSLARGENKAIIFGKDYPTEDGTAVRDYIHVMDLANAHILGLKYLLESNACKSGIYNLGDGKGYSVLEIIKRIRNITGKELKIEYIGRREGDPAVLVADYTKIKNDIGFEFKFNIDDIINSAWKWHSMHLNGFSSR